MATAAIGQEDSSHGRRGQPSPPKMQDCGCRPRCDFYWPPLLPRSARPSSSLVFVTRVMNDSISVHICSDWIMRETIVSREWVVRYCPTDSLAVGAPSGTDKECVLCIFHNGYAVATRLIVSFLEALQVRIKATMSRKRLRQVKTDLTVFSIQPGGELWVQRCVHLPDWSPCHLVCHFSTSLRFPSLRMAFARAITCRFVKQVSSLRSWKVFFLFSANKSIGGTLARTSTALVDTFRYAETILSTTPLCAENSFFSIVWLLRKLAQTGAA